MLSSLPVGAAANAPRRKQAEISRALLSELTDAESVVKAAQVPDYQTALAKFEITPQQIAELAAQVAQGQQLSAEVISQRRGEKVTTASIDKRSVVTAVSVWREP